jgi:hypothetical protein
MDLREELVFKAAKGPKLELTLPEEEGEQDKLTLSLKGQFTKTVAAVLGVDWMFAGETTGHSGMKDCNLSRDISFADCELKLKGAHGELDTFFPDTVYGFRAFAAGGASLGIQCKVDITGDFNVLLDFFRKHMADGFQFSIRSRQGQLFEGGTRVNMSPEQEPSDPPSDEVDRSHENKPKGGRRKKITPINVEAVASESSDKASQEWDEFYNKTAESAGEVDPVEELIQ